jgi:hypothetical protein
MPQWIKRPIPSRSQGNSDRSPFAVHAEWDGRDAAWSERRHKAEVGTDSPSEADGSFIPPMVLVSAGAHNQKMV